MSQFSCRIEHYPRLSSTMKLSQKRALAGEKEGLVIWADAIEEAVGRHDRKWHAPVGGLWISVLLRPPISPTQAGVFNYLAPLAVCRGIDELSPTTFSLKWPNDVVTRDSNRKISGFLAQARLGNDHLDHIIWGIGLNVSNDLPETLVYHGEKPRDTVATTLHQEGGKAMVEEVLQSFLNHLEDLYRQLEEKEFDCTGIGPLVEERLSTLGQDIRLYTGEDEYVEGRAVALERETGRLVVELKGGERKVFDAGDCWHLRRAN